MPKKLRLLLGSATFLAVAVTIAILAERTLNLPPVPVSITLVPSAASTNSARSPFEPLFWVTNHTSKLLCVTPWAIEVKQGTNWTKYDYHAPPVYISPHAAADVTVDFTRQPYQQPTNTWRLTINVAEKLDGAHAFLQKLNHYPRWLRLRSNTNFNIVPSPFTKGAIWYGNPRKVRSEDISATSGG